jgi:hypothetical protein
MPKKTDFHNLLNIMTVDMESEQFEESLFNYLIISSFARVFSSFLNASFSEWKF